MGLNNIFYATNPARMADALWHVMCDSGVNVADMLIFLPSRRALRTVEKMIAGRMGGVAILPRLVALGEGVDDADLPDVVADDIISNTERVVVLARLLAADVSVGNLTTALPVARDLVRMQDYLENEGINPADIDWAELVDEKYATHFQNKARILNILSGFMDEYANGRITAVAARNRDIRAWAGVLDKYKLVIVCASTASVPATADLMCEIARCPHGRIILSGKISGNVADFELNTNPYNSEYKFLKRLGLGADDVLPIDVGVGAIDFMNVAFGNDTSKMYDVGDMSHCHLVECPREAVEANAVAQIVKQSVAQNKSVLVITPDAAGNQRIATAFNAQGIDADFSGGVDGTKTRAGRAILNLLDSWIESDSGAFDRLYVESGCDLFNTLANMVDKYIGEFMPQFVPEDEQNTALWVAVKEMSDAVRVAGLTLQVSDARALLADAFAGVSIRAPMKDDVDVVVLGTIESRMQTADVVILTGLNEGMFPATGYENAWLPRAMAEKIGLPSSDRKVSLQALDFMNLSCAPCVYWLRSKVSGGVQTAESRFISRVVVRHANINTDDATQILDAVARQDDVPYVPLDYSAPTPPADWSDVYVTELEMLIHNPYAFYVRHILRLRVLDDYWALPDARAFGNLVHDVVEHAHDLRPEVLIAQMDARALEILGRDSVLYHFWHKRFCEIAPVVALELAACPNAWAEIPGHIKIGGRTVRARADRVWDGGVLDIKTGAAPNKKQLTEGNMPQLPLEALMLKTGGFAVPTTRASQTPVMRFLQLKNNDARIIEYDAETTAQMMRAAHDKVVDLFNIYSAGGASYEYRETGDQKYKVYDDLARIKD